MANKIQFSNEQLSNDIRTLLGTNTSFRQLGVQLESAPTTDASGNVGDWYFNADPTGAAFYFKVDTSAGGRWASWDASAPF